jgi:peptide/nickel transport system substrate-binding protein
VNEYTTSRSASRGYLSRRSALQVLVLGLGTTLLAACGGTAQAPASSGAPTAPSSAPQVASPTSATAKPAAAATSVSAPAAKPEAQPKSGGTLRTGIPTDLARLDGHQSTVPLPASIGLVYDRLVAYDAMVQPKPMLAESWEVSTDWKEIKLNLRKGVTYHSGREFTSDDVKYNLFRGRDPKAGTGTYVNQSKWFDSIDTPDKYTTVLKSDVPRPAAFDYLNVLNIIDKETQEGPDAQAKAVGTGPFTFVEWVQGDHVTLAKNANYWRTGRPYLDGVLVSITKDVVAGANTLRAGALDALNAPTLNDFVEFKKDSNFQALTPVVQTSALAMGATTLLPPTNDKRVRQALNWAIDRKRVAESVLQGIVPPFTLPWDQNSEAYEGSKGNRYTFDLDKARSLLAEAGVTNAEFDFLPAPDFPEWDLIAQLYQGDLAKIGIKMNIRKYDLAAWLDQVNNRKYTGMWASTMLILLGSPASSFANGRGTDPTSNNEGFTNDRYAQLVANAGSEPDASKRKQIYSELNDIVLDESFIMALAPFPARLVVSNRVHDVQSPDATRLDNFAYTDAWLS